MIMVPFTEGGAGTGLGEGLGRGCRKEIHDVFICRHAKFVVSALSDVHGEDLYEDDC